MISKIAVLQGTEFFRTVTPEALKSLAERAEVRKVAAGGLLFSAGEPCRGLFVVVEGWTRAFRHGVDGREQVIHEDGPGGTFPEVAVFDDGPYPSTVVASHDTTLLFLHKDDVKRFCLAYPQAALSALRIMSRRLRRVTGMLERLALLEVSQRVAGYLIQELPERSSRAVTAEFELKHTNQEIADRVGTVREVVSRAFASFQRRGWLEKENRTLRIKDIEALRRHAAGEG